MKKTIENKKIKKKEIVSYNRDDRSYIMLISAMICFFMPLVLGAIEGILNTNFSGLGDKIGQGFYLSVPLLIGMQISINKTKKSIILSVVLLIIYILIICFFIIFFIFVIRAVTTVLPGVISDFLRDLSNIG